MSARLPAVVVFLLALLSSPPAAAQLDDEAWDTSGARHLEVTPDNAGEAHPVGISPHQLTGLVFGTPLRPGGVEVEDARWLKVAVNEAEGLVMLLPSGEPPPDKALTVTVRFADDLVPESVTFRLVVHPTRAEHQVRVYRHPRSAESYRQGERQERERAERCEAVLEAERVRPEGQPTGNLSDLFDAGLVMEGKGIVGRRLVRGKDFEQRSGEALEITAAYSYSAQLQGQVAVELHVSSTGTPPWTAEGVEGTVLVSAEGVRLRVLRVWQPEPSTPAAHRRVVVVAEAPGEQSRGAFVLQLRETGGGARAVTVRRVTFP